jgi:hypothetical protein
MAFAAHPGNSSYGLDIAIGVYRNKLETLGTRH